MIEAQFEGLLRWLASDREAAGVTYEALRQRLIALFRFWGSDTAEESADEAFSRVAARLHAGEEVRIESRFAYLRGVARFILLEELRRRGRQREAIGRQAEPVPGPDLDSDARERASCLARCLQQLDPETRDAVLTYYQGQERERIDRRQQLAERLGIGVVPLRNRMQRLREKLRSCTGECVGDSSQPQMRN